MRLSLSGRNAKVNAPFAASHDDSDAVEVVTVGAAHDWSEAADQPPLPRLR
jgi:hypothetical protein